MFLYFSLFVSLFTSSLFAHEDIQNLSQKVSISCLILPGCRKKEIVEDYCQELFLKGNTAAIRLLMRTLDQSCTATRTAVYAAIIDWIIENHPLNSELFISKLPQRALSRYYDLYDSTLKDYILRKTIDTHSNNVIPMLLRHFSLQELMVKNYAGKSYLNYAIEADNKEAANLMSDHISFCLIHKKNGGKSKYFLLGGTGIILGGIIIVGTTYVFMAALAPLIATGLLFNALITGLTTSKILI